MKPIEHKIEINPYRVQRGKADWPPRLMARPRGGVRPCALAVSDKP